MSCRSRVGVRIATPESVYEMSAFSCRAQGDFPCDWALNQAKLPLGGAPSCRYHALLWECSVPLYKTLNSQLYSQGCKACEEERSVLLNQYLSFKMSSLFPIRAGLFAVLSCGGEVLLLNSCEIKWSSILQRWSWYCPEMNFVWDVGISIQGKQELPRKDLVWGEFWFWMRVSKAGRRRKGKGRVDGVYAQREIVKERALQHLFTIFILKLRDALPRIWDLLILHWYDSPVPHKCIYPKTLQLFLLCSWCICCI